MHCDLVYSVNGSQLRETFTYRSRTSWQSDTLLLAQSSMLIYKPANCTSDLKLWSRTLFYRQLPILKGIPHKDGTSEIEALDTIPLNSAGNNQLHIILWVLK